MLMLIQYQNRLLPALYLQLVADLSVVKAAQQANSNLSPVITSLAQGHPLPSDIAPGLNCTF